jgi:stage II sporulation protein AA (anti-sigma F factor antagonist)
MKLGDVLFTESGSVLIATLSGEIDMSNAERIGGTIAETASNQELGLILDLSPLYYLDSAGIHLVFRLRERLRARGQSLALVIPAESASNDAIRLAGVTIHIDTFESLDEALRAASNSDSHRSADPIG